MRKLIILSLALNLIQNVYADMDIKTQKEGDNFHWNEKSDQLIYTRVLKSASVKNTISLNEDTRKQLKSFQFDILANAKKNHQKCRLYVSVAIDGEEFKVCKENKELTGTTFGVINSLKKNF